MKTLLAVLLALLTSRALPAEEFTATVTHVHDGDTAHVQRADGTIVKVRFVYCDTPEIGQPHGIAARDFVADMILGEQVTVKSDELDQHGRALGEITVNGTNVNKAIIEKGHGWWFYHYHSEVELGELEAAAKSQKLGLWNDQNPIYPRNWRAGARVNGAAPAGGGPSDGTSTAPESSVFIMALMPNLAGQDANNETVILANGTDVEVTIDQWKLEDDDGGVFTLSGTIPASGTLTVRLNSSLQLGNGGDDVTLRNAAGEAVHELGYGTAKAGRFILAGD